MNHTIIPVTAQGEPIPLIKLGQGREESGSITFDCSGAFHSGAGAFTGGSGLRTENPQTFAAKLRAAGCQGPVLSKESAQEKISNSTPPLVELTQEEFNALTGRGLDTPVVSREGFRAGVLSAIAGGVIIACFYLAWGLVAACLFTAVCIGFVAGMVITQEWK